MRIIQVKPRCGFTRLPSIYLKLVEWEISRANINCMLSFDRTLFWRSSGHGCWLHFLISAMHYCNPSSRIISTVISVMQGRWRLFMTPNFILRIGSPLAWGCLQAIMHATAAEAPQQMNWRHSMQGRARPAREGCYTFWFPAFFYALFGTLVPAFKCWCDSLIEYYRFHCCAHLRY